MTLQQAKKMLAEKFQMEEKQAGLILSFIEREIGMHPPTLKVRSWVTHCIEEWAATEMDSESVDE